MCIVYGLNYLDSKLFIAMIPHTQIGSLAMSQKPRSLTPVLWVYKRTSRSEATTTNGSVACSTSVGRPTSWLTLSRSKLTTAGFHRIHRMGVSNKLDHATTPACQIHVFQCHHVGCRTRPLRDCRELRWWRGNSLLARCLRSSGHSRLRTFHFSGTP